MGKDDDVIHTKDHLEKNPQAQNYEGEPCVVQCPHCSGIEWAVCQEEKSAGISYLVCVSDECDGDSYIEVNGGFPSDEVIHFEVEFENPVNDDDDKDRN